jgi:2-polyprenyl-6-methoxyphenol hydroxylase-like FAD-dependent oxidoreductase
VPRTIETPVLIVGAGPVGLSLALELGWRGVECMIIDQSEQDVVLPRASGLSSRTMEFCRRWGVVEDIAKAGFPQDYDLDIVYCTSLTGYELEREPFPALGDRVPPDHSPQARHRCPQKLLDPVLERAVRAQPTVTLHRKWRLEHFEDHGDGVTAQVRVLEAGRLYDFSGDHVEANSLSADAGSAGDGERVTIRARYLVACDGVDSPVRNALGIGLDGTPVINYTISLLVRSKDLHRKHPMGAAERYMLVGPEGVWGNLTVVDGRDEWRLSLKGSKQKLDLANLDADAIVRRCIGRDDIPFTVEAVSPWRRREVVASRLSQGNVFLAGDAAHAMSPTGGFGMNVGIADAVDLAWKLEAMLEGWGGPQLMDTYHVERKPVGDRFVTAATALFKPWMMKLDYARVCDATPEGEAARKQIGETLKRELYPEWDIAGTSMGYRYDTSPIVVGDGTPPPPDDPVVYVQSSRPGSRAPHAWLEDGRSTLDLFGRGFVLMRFAGRHVDVAPLQEAARRRSLPLTVVDIADPAIAALYERRLVLVRPDGHTAWRSDVLPDDPQALVDIVRGAATPAALATGQRAREAVTPR